MGVVPAGSPSVTIAKMAAILEISYLDIEIIPDLLKHIIIHAEYHLAAIKCNKMQPKAFLGFIIGF